jgi:pimeloyl-ACP methyl ester carboxylesterase
MESPPGSERVSRRLREQFAPAYLAITGLVQVLGQGPPDLVLARRSYGHIDVAWEDPGITLFLRTLASFCRLILFDRRGTGPSDPLPPGPLPHGSRTPRS